LELTGEVVWSKPFPKINVKYRNIDVVHFRVYEVDWQERVKGGRYFQLYYNGDEIEELLNKKPLVEWSSKLKVQTDYKEHFQQVSPIDNLKPGFYCVVGSYRSDFKKGDNQISHLLFWVSEIEIVEFSHNGTIDGLVVQAGSGTPVKSATVTAYTSIKMEK
jgi:uncharacterized protein YfaS (alpha-2-macroglobulin family)